MRTLLLLLLTLPVFADIIHLKSGGKIEGKVAEDLGDSYRIETATGTLVVKKEDIEKIEPKAFTPPERSKKPPSRVVLETTIRDPFWAFRIKAPRKWQKGQAFGGAHVSLYGPKDEFYTPRIDLFVEKITLSLDDYVRKHQEALKGNKDYSEVKFVAVESFQVGEYKGMKFVAKFNESIVPMQTAWSFVDTGDRKFTVMYYCTAKLYERYEAEVTAILGSLRPFEDSKLDEAAQRRYSLAYNDGVDLMQKSKFSEAMAQFEKIRDLTPKFPDAYNAVGLCYKNLRKWKEAADAFRQAAKLDPDEFSYQLNLCIMLIQAGELETAQTYADRCIELDPTNEGGYTNKGVLLVLKKEYAKARDMLIKATEINPESFIAHYNLGVCFEELGDKKSAIKEFKDTLKINSNHKGAKEGLERLK